MVLSNVERESAIWWEGTDDAIESSYSRLIFESVRDLGTVEGAVFDGDISVTFDPLRERTGGEEFTCARDAGGDLAGGRCSLVRRNGGGVRSWSLTADSDMLCKIFSSVITQAPGALLTILEVSLIGGRLKSCDSNVDIDG